MHPEPLDGPDPAPASPQLLLCAPPYQVLSQVPLAQAGIEPAWGSAVCATGQSVLATLELLMHAAERWPWIAPTLALPDTERATSRRAPVDDVLAERLSILYLGRDAESSVTPQRVISAVALRDSPTPRALALWASRRLNARTLLEPLEEQFGFALGERSPLPRSDSTYNRRFGRASELSARDWRAVARLVRALCTEVRRKQSHQAAASAGTFPGSKRSARRYARRYLGMAWTTAAGLVGWEWVMESALAQRGQSLQE